MDGQQVFVTGADGEQMVLSGPEAAALLAQAGISLGDQEQVMMGDSGDCFISRFIILLNSLALPFIIKLKRKRQILPKAFHP